MRGYEQWSLNNKAFVDCDSHPLSLVLSVCHPSTRCFFIRTKFIRTQAFGHPEIKNMIRTGLSSAIKLRTPMSRWELYVMIKCMSSFVYSLMYLQHVYFYKNWFICLSWMEGEGIKTLKDFIPKVIMRCFYKIII